MISECSFVAHAFNAKHPQTFLHNIRIRGGRMLASDGLLTLATPVDSELDIDLNGERFIKACAAFKKKTPNAYVTETGRLCLADGKLRVYVPAQEGVYEFPTPEGTPLEIPDASALMDGLAAISGVIDPNALHEYQRGMLIRNACIYATNGRVLVQRYIGAPFPRVLNIPARFGDTLLALDRKPVRALCNETSISVIFDNGAYLRSQLYSTEWPNVDELLENVHKWIPDNAYVASPPVREAAKRVAALAGAQSVAFTRESITAVAGDASATIAGGVANVPDGGAVTCDAADVERALSVATAVWLGGVPAAFRGPSLRGVMVGRLA